MDYHWTLESWGDAYPPENAEEIVSSANELIDAYAGTHDEDSTQLYSDQLWEFYCSHDTLPSSGINDHLDYEDRLIEQRVDEG